MAGEVIEIIFLSKDVGLGELFAAAEALENDGAFAFRGEGGAASGVDGVGLAFAALLGGSVQREGKSADKENAHGGFQASKEQAVTSFVRQGL